MTEGEIVTAARDHAITRGAEARVSADACDGDVRDAFADVAVVLDRLVAALPKSSAEESKS